MAMAGISRGSGLDGGRCDARIARKCPTVALGGAIPKASARKGPLMDDLVTRVIETLRQRSLLPSIPEGADMPVPAINKVEFYPTFRCNDRCAHCITSSGPDETEALTPEDAATIVEHIARFSILRRLKLLYGDGQFHCEVPERCRELETKARTGVQGTLRALSLAGAAGVLLLAGLLSKEVVLVGLPVLSLWLWLGRGIRLRLHLPLWGAALLFCGMGMFLLLMAIAALRGILSRKKNSREEHQT